MSNTKQIMQDVKKEVSTTETKRYVYFIQKGKFVKIGSSNNPEQRVYNLQTGSNQKLKLLFKTDAFSEEELQTKFNRYKDTNEWFFLSREIKTFIAIMKESSRSKEKVTEESDYQINDASVLRIDLNKEDTTKFRKLQKLLGIKSKSDVMRFCLTFTCNNYLNSEKLKKGGA